MWMFIFHITKILCIWNAIAYSSHVYWLSFYVVRSLISKLEEVDPRKLNHEEKLAFWINVHNSLMMHVTIFHNFKRLEFFVFLVLLRLTY